MRGVQEDQDERRKNDGRGFEPATLASAVGLLARRSLTRRRKIKTKEEKMTGGGFEPATLASAVGLLARRSLTRCRKCPEADGNAYSRQSPYRLVVRTSHCGRDNPGSTPGEEISSGQSEEKKTCLHHCIISKNLQLDSL